MEPVMAEILEALGTLVKKVKVKVDGGVLHDLALTLDTIQIYAGEDLHGISSDQLERFRKEIEDGSELLHETLKHRTWNIWRWSKYNKKFAALNKSLRDMIDIMRIQAMNNAAKTWSTVRTAENRIEEMSQMTNWNEEPELPYFTVGLTVPLLAVRNKIQSEDNPVVVITGAGGCGKTTLAATLYFDAKIREIFNNKIFFITVGHRPNITSMLQQVYQQVSSEAETSFQDEVTEAISEERWNLLLIFDDVWPQTESIIETIFLNGNEKRLSYKILVTSRCQLFPLQSSSYHISSLDDEDSMTLLRQSAFPGGMRINVPNDLLSQVVEFCKGHPLAIVMAGKFLRGMPIESWRNTIFKWSNGYQTLDSKNRVLDVLRISLQGLDNKLRECFLDFALFPDSQAIYVPAIFDIWEQRYDLCLDSMCYEILHELATRSLVNLVVRRKVEVSEEDYSEHFVIHHDLLRDLAINEVRNDPVLSKRLNIDICGDTVPKWWTGVEEQVKKPKQVSLLSISTDEFFTKWPIMKVPVAEVVLLNCRTKNYELPKFIRDMRKSLKVLILQNHGSPNAAISHFDRLSSLSNLKTIRFYGITVSSLTKDHIYLKSLQKISFCMCSIRQAFGKVTGRISYALPNVVEINIDYCRDLVELEDDICNLFHLKKLSITNCHRLSALPENLGKLINLEILSLRSCSDVVELPSSICYLKKLNFLNISRCFSIKKLPEEIGFLSSLRKLNMVECSRLRELPISIFELHLEVVICDEYTQELWERSAPIVSTVIKVVKPQLDLQWLERLDL